MMFVIALLVDGLSNVWISLLKLLTSHEDQGTVTITTDGEIFEFTVRRIVFLVRG